MKEPPFSFDIFLSYSSKDKACVRLLAERLRAAGVRVWFDEWIIKPGDDIYLAIEHGLEVSRTLILCLSPNAFGSDWVGLERSTVLFRDPSNKGRRFIPLLLADCDLPDTLRRYKYLDFREETDGTFEKLLHACLIEKKLGLLTPRIEPDTVSIGKMAQAGKSTTTSTLGGNYKIGLQRLGNLLNEKRGKLQHSISKIIEKCEIYEEYVHDQEGVYKLDISIHEYEKQANNLKKIIQDIKASGVNELSKQKQNLKNITTNSNMTEKEKRKLRQTVRESTEMLNKIKSNLEYMKHLHNTYRRSQDWTIGCADLVKSKEELENLKIELIDIDKGIEKIRNNKIVDQMSNLLECRAKAEILSYFANITYSLFHVHFADLCRENENLPQAVRFVHSLVPAHQYQERPELDMIIDWWLNEWQNGICALVGLGGSGKTALTYRFIELLKKVDESGLYPPLAPPDMLFVWSFYEEPDSEAFATALLNFITNQSDVESSTGYFGDTIRRIQYYFDSNPSLRVLVVMDGLERIQEDRSGFSVGDLSDLPLRQFLRRMTRIGNARVLITSRYPITDLSNWKNQGYLELRVDKLPEDTCIALLRNRGVKGRDLILKSLTHDFGAHALTLDHLAGILVSFFEGDPHKVSHLPPLDSEELKGTCDKQGMRLIRIFSFYEKRLPHEHVNLLSFISCFRFSVTLETLQQLLDNSKFYQNLGGRFRLPKRISLTSALSSLKSHSLVYSEIKNGDEKYVTHPAVREFFYRRITEVEEVHRNVALILSSRLDTVISKYSDSTLSALEELIFHLIMAGDVKNALALFRDKLGGYEVLGEQLGMYQRGDTLLQFFTPYGHTPPGTPRYLNEGELAYFYKQRSLFSSHLGNLRLGISSLKACLRRTPVAFRNENYLSINIQLLNYNILVGELESARQHSIQILEMFDNFFINEKKRLNNEITSMKISAERLKNTFLKENYKILLKEISSLESDVAKLNRDNNIPKTDYERLRLQLESMIIVLDALTQGVFKKSRQSIDQIDRTWWSIHGNLWLIKLNIRHLDTNIINFIKSSRCSIIEEPLGLHTCRWKLALASLIREESEISAKIIADCLEWAEININQEILVESLLERARTSLVIGDYIKAQMDFRDGFIVAEESGLMLHIIDLLILMAEIYIKIGRPDDSLPLSERAYGLSKRCNFIWGTLDSMVLILRAQQLNGKTGELYELIRLCTEMHIQVGIPIPSDIIFL